MTLITSKNYTNQVLWNDNFSILANHMVVVVNTTYRLSIIHSNYVSEIEMNIEKTGERAKVSSFRVRHIRHWYFWYFTPWRKFLHFLYTYLAYVCIILSSKRERLNCAARHTSVCWVRRIKRRTSSNHTYQFVKISDQLVFLFWNIV